MSGEFSAHVTTLVLILCCSLFFGTSDAINCFQCSSSTAGCGDPFDKSLMREENSCTGARYCTKTTNTLKNDVVAVGRDCFSTGTVITPNCNGVFTSTFQGYECFCDHDYCNLATRYYVSSYLLIAALSVAAVMHLLRRTQ